MFYLYLFRVFKYSRLPVFLSKNNFLTFIITYIFSRILEGIKNKIPKDPVVYQWMLQELAPVMEELGIKTPDDLGLNIAPEGKGPLPY